MECSLGKQNSDVFLLYISGQLDIDWEKMGDRESKGDGSRVFVGRNGTVFRHFGSVFSVFGFLKCYINTISN